MDNHRKESSEVDSHHPILKQDIILPDGKNVSEIATVKCIK